MATVLITGASGLLGRSVFETLSSQKGINLHGWANTRTGKSYTKVDLTDSEAISSALNELQPDIIIHCAAIRRPDSIKDNESLAQSVNVESTRQLAKFIANRDKGFLVFISTDYVFDGTNPPYDESAKTNPLNAYGVQKVQGENVVQEIAPSKSAILRIPILYGPVEYLGEGAVDEILKNILNAKDEPMEMDHYHIRCPTHVQDISRAILMIVQKRLENASISGIFHWCGTESLTKYEMALQMSQSFNLPTSKFIADTSPPDPSKSAARPKNAQLSCQKLSSLGLESKWTFMEGIKESLECHVTK